MPTHLKIASVARLWRLALPLIIANIATPLLGLADAAISGHLDHTYYLAAVTVGAELLVIFFGTFSFLRMGTTGLVAQAVGANDPLRSVSLLSNAVFMALLIGLALMLLGSHAIHPILQLAKPTTEMTQPLEQYLTIRLWGAPAHLILLALTGWFIGQGLTRIALLLAVSINVLNIGLNYFLAIELNMNSQGIALGTVISEYAAVAFAVVMLLRQLKRQSLVLTSPWDVGLQIQLLKINLPLMLRTLLLHSVFVTLAVLSARLGIIEAAAIGLMLVLLATAAYALDGFAYAAEIEAGQALGERHLRRFIESLWAGAALSFVSAVMIVAGLMLFHTHIFSALTDFQRVIHQASELMAWFYWIVLVLCWSYWLDGVFIGLTKSLDMCIAMTVATSVGWFGSLWILEATTVDHLMAAFLIFSVVRVIALGIRLPAMVAEVRRLSTLSRPEFEPV